MASGVNVPLTFKVYKGDELVRSVTLNQDIIKIGKLSSSHLRVDDESVSRIHAVIEIAAADDISIIDLGSTSGTLLNGEKVTKGKLKSGDELRLGDTRVVVTVEQPQESEDVTLAGVLPPSVTDPQLLSQAPVSRVTTMGIPAFQGQAPVAAAPAAAAPYPAPAFTGTYDAEAVEVRDGSRAVEVAAMFEDAVLEMRHLRNPQAGTVSGATKALLASGAVALVFALGLFLFEFAQVAKIRAAREAWDKAGKAYHEFRITSVVGSDSGATGAAATVLLLYGVVGLFFGLARLTEEKEEGDFTIGTDEKALFKTADGLPAPLFPLVRSTGQDYEVTFASPMEGDLSEGGKRQTLADAIQSGRARPSGAVAGAYSLGLLQDTRVNLRFGDTTFNITSTPPPRRYPVPLTIDWRTQAYTAAVFLITALFLLMIFMVPPDPKSLALDAFLRDNRLAQFLIKPQQEKEEIPEWLKKKGPDEAGGKGKRHKDEEGKMGKKESKNKQGLYALKGPKDNTDPHLAKELATEQAKNAGVLGILKATQGSHLASIFGRDSALGTDASDVLGGLVGTEVGEAYGVGGLGLVGTGRGGGGTGEGTIGLGNLGTIGKGGGGGSGSGYGRGAGGLGGRRTSTPEVVPGTAEVRGSLDKEIIRRIIRRHMNEVKFCYEKELVKNGNLAGRVMVQFTISGTGQVIASVVQSSTMNNPPSETCIAQAVKRWEFPKPNGGGIVVVTYPFVMKTAAGE